MARPRKRRLNKIDIYIIVLSLFTASFIGWCAWEFHLGRDEPVALIGLVGAYIVVELFSLAKIKVSKRHEEDSPTG